MTLTTNPMRTPETAPPTERKQRRRRWAASRWPALILVVVAAVTVFIATRGRAPSYVLGRARDGTVSETVAVSGALAPTRSWNLYFPSPGTIASVPVSVGEHVRRGQVLARLDPAALQTQVSSAQAAVSSALAKLSADQANVGAHQAKLDGDEAKQDARPAKTSAQSTAATALITADQSGLTADQSAVTADQDAQAAAAQQLSTAKANLAAATLRAPAAATVAQVNISAGQNIGGGGGGQSGSGGSNQTTPASATTGGSSPAIALAGSSLEAVGQVPDSQITQVRLGQRALVTPAGQSTPIDGQVQAVAPTSTSSGGVVTYAVQIGLAAHHTRVFDGMSAQISIIVATASGVTVPSSAVRTSGNRNWVTVLRGGRVRDGRAHGGHATRQTIRVGPSGGGLTIVRSGLRAGEQVALADSNTPLPSSASNSQKGSGKASQVRKLLG